MNIPRNQWVDRRTPFILDHVEVRMTYTTVQHFKGYIFLTSFPAQKKLKVQFLDYKLVHKS